MEEYTLAYKRITRPAQDTERVLFRDTFQTPNYATDLLVPFIPKVSIIWEPACGNGKISKRLQYHGFSTFCTDISFNPDVTDLVWNFVTDGEIRRYYPNSLYNFAIVTNPPYSIKTQFIERAFEYNVPFAFLINADYSGQQINWIERGCEKIIPNRRINYITPTGRQGETSGSQFHSMWLTYGFGLGRTETFVDLPIKEIKENI